MREPNLELWHQRRKELEREAKMNRLGRELRAARRRASPQPRVQGGGLTGWFGRVAAVRRLLRETGPKFRLRPRRQPPSGCPK